MSEKRTSQLRLPWLQLTAATVAWLPEAKRPELLQTLAELLLAAEADATQDPGSDDDDEQAHGRARRA